MYVHTMLGEFEDGDFTLKDPLKTFRFTLRRKNLKMQKSQVTLDLCLSKTQSGNSWYYRGVHA